MKNDVRWDKALYTTDTYNIEGLDGHAYAKNGIEVQTSSPLNDNPGTNPEQLLGMSLCTCLVGTMEVILKEHKIDVEPRAHAKISYVRGKEHNEFLVHAQVAVPGQTLSQTRALVSEVENRCCVSQLLRGNDNYSLEAVLDLD